MSNQIDSTVGGATGVNAGRQLLSPPSVSPLQSVNGDSGASTSSRPNTPGSLSAYYFPSKFSDKVVVGGVGPRRRKRQDLASPPKPGGGRGAFRAGEARMPGATDEDEYIAPPPRWNRFKWVLLIANVIFSIYSVISFIACLLTWFDVWDHADVIRVANRTELIMSTLAATLAVIASLLGWAGLLLNNRAFLATYTLFLWFTFAFLVIPGYLTYKKRAFNLEGKLNLQWSRQLGVVGRMQIQNSLKCCGYFSPYVEAAVSQTCYSRSILPGCKKHFLTLERTVLENWYTVVFALVPVHIAVMLAALLCSNHVTYRFGKGMMPDAYRLGTASMATIMESYARELADQYGSDANSEFFAARSRTNLLDHDAH